MQTIKQHREESAKPGCIVMINIEDEIRDECVHSILWTISMAEKTSHTDKYIFKWADGQIEEVKS